MGRVFRNQTKLPGKKSTVYPGAAERCGELSFSFSWFIKLDETRAVQSFSPFCFLSIPNISADSKTLGILAGEKNFVRKYSEMIKEGIGQKSHIGDQLFSLHNMIVSDTISKESAASYSSRESLGVYFVFWFANEQFS